MLVFSDLNFHWKRKRSCKNYKNVTIFRLNLVLKTLANIDISPEQWHIVSAILQKHIPDKTVWAFGSRVTHTAKPYSDLDLAIISDSELSISLLAALEHDFTESDLPFKVDIVDWAATSPGFQAIIKNRHAVLKIQQ